MGHRRHTDLRGSAISPIPSRLGRHLYRFAEVRGERARLDWVCQSVVAPGPMRPPSEHVDEIVRGMSWRTRSCYTFRESSHVNLQEMRAIKNELRRALALGDSCARRQIVFTDSRVCVGAGTKGRSWSYRLNGILRSMLPYLCSSGISLHYVWVSTLANPADGPSRGRPLPEPSAGPLPGWIAQLR